MPRDGQIPDPGLTLSETVNVMGEILTGIKRSGSDSVLQSAWEKLRVAAAEFSVEHPEEHASVMAEVQMRKRFSE